MLYLLGPIYKRDCEEHRQQRSWSTFYFILVPKKERIAARK